jgi:hypothetical protein
VADIRERNGQITARPEILLHLPEHILRRDQVLQNILEDDHVEGGKSKVRIKVQLLDIPNDHLIAVLSGKLASLRVDLDAGDSIPPLFEDPADVAGGRADFKNVFVLAGQFYDKGMATVSILQVDDRGFIPF